MKTYKRCHGCKTRTFKEVIVAEGNGVKDSPIREAHYFYDEEDALVFIDDPLANDCPLEE